MQRYTVALLALLPVACQAPAADNRPATPAPVLSDAAAPPDICDKLHATASIQLTLMFGMTRPNGGVITESEWRSFLRDVITPRFPAGLTVQNSLGQWQDRTTGRIGTEPSRLVWIVTEGTPDLAEKITSIRTGYMQKFAQQAVGLNVVRGCSSF
ncbi:DUF3574 domain-containing protein [Acetobacter oeni]|uniref:Lipoprotein n=1 Tax=Acetobacter oeni TaxID=304077 RepID=A0A511XM07_9PROT|nr:DUF3574 domain-containing protein [Acetobacter oeni]MBB3883992.1 hypothetical protein [Acetobacter oeni]NHO20051.1 DUF3574 domain-containing protein [Acetobacter oeni]GBR03809.1 hypothetical protein AA21952_1180 [Acetobacter oeni LMG 21952]GEN63982.1 hypothetical protein AOE01nite_22060 [Acetobacter oeni]